MCTSHMYAYVYLYFTKHKKLFQYYFGVNEKKEEEEEEDNIHDEDTKMGGIGRATE